MKDDVNKFLIPYCTYTHPEIATVGLTEQTLISKNIKYDVYTKHFNHNDRALCESEEGVYKVFTRAGKDEILGASLAGGPAGDMIGFIGSAMTNNIGLFKLGSAVFPYPTYSEIFRQMADAY